MKQAAERLAGTHREWMVETLRQDRSFAIELFRQSLEALDSDEDRSASLSALRDIAEAYGGLGAVAAQAGISRESLYRSLSPKGNPTLKTLIAVLKTLNLRLSVVEAEPVKKKRAKAKTPKRKAA